MLHDAEHQPGGIVLEEDRSILHAPRHEIGREFDIGRSQVELDRAEAVHHLGDSREVAIGKVLEVTIGKILDVNVSASHSRIDPDGRVEESFCLWDIRAHLAAHRWRLGGLNCPGFSGDPLQ